MFDHDAFRHYFLNTGWMMLERVARLTVALVIGIYVVRHLGPGDFGLLSYAISFTGLFSSLTTLGLEGVLVRELVRNADLQKRLLGSAFVLRQFGAAIAFSLAIGAAIFFHDPGHPSAPWLIAIIATGNFFQAFTVIECHFQARVQARVLVRAQLFQTLISALLRIALIEGQAPLLWFALAVLFDSLVLGLTLAVIYLRGEPGRLTSWRPDAAVALSLFKQAWPLMLSGLAISFYMKIDQVMLEHMLGEVAVGQYAAAVQLVEAWYFVPMVIANSLFPAIIRAKESADAKHYHIRLQQLYSLMIWLALTLAIPTSLLSGWIVQILYGPAYEATGSVLALYIWASVFVFFGVARSKWVIIENQQMYAIVYLSAGALANIGGNYLLIPTFGIMGAAYATLLSLIFSMLVIPFLLNALQRQQVHMFVRGLIFPLQVITRKAPQ